MEKEIGKIQKNENTEIIIRIDDFGGKRGVTIREFVTGERYTGFTKAGTRIPADKFLEFRELINKIDIEDLKEEPGEGEVVREAPAKENEGEEQKELGK